MNPFNMGFLEILLILIVALILFGPQRLIEVGTGLGKAFREFRRSLSSVESALAEEQTSSEASSKPGEMPGKPREDELSPKDGVSGGPPSEASDAGFRETPPEREPDHR